jgi:cyclophilin family peptidyl-prolyl cis-trans isomerase
MITIKTSAGDIVLELFEKDAPVTVKNFLQYVTSGHFKGTIFHRVISGFMIQGGGFDTSFRQLQALPSIKNEATAALKNARGTIAMARTSDINSATCQFFINLADNDFLDHRDNTSNGFGYCAFGKVTSGMDVVDKIAKVKTSSKGMHADVPVENVIITDVVSA